MRSSVGHSPDGPWVFDDDVTACFEDMLSRSIPDLRGMRSAVTRVTNRFAPTGGAILDIGSSRGDTIADILRTRPDLKATACECSQPMVAALRSRFDGVVGIDETDLRRGFPRGTYDVITSVLVVQFTPIEYRHRIIRSCFDALRPGGALVLVEKVIGASSVMDEVLTGEYLKLKSENGYSQEDISRKRLSLEGVLVPVTAEWNEDMLRQAGFLVSPIWRWFNFVGWVAIRPHK